jgi:hypothetical protein
MTRISPATIAAFEQMAAAHQEQARRISEAFTAEMRQWHDPAIGRAIEAGQMSSASQIAAGRPPDGLPSIGATAAAYRRRLSASRLAARHGITPATAQTLWNMYKSGLWADECRADRDGIARADLLTSTPPMTRWPARGPRLVVSCTRPSRGLAARWASHAPPRGQDSHMPSVNAGGATTT